MTQPNDRLCALADSLPAAIRWRYCDYKQLFRKQLEILLEADAARGRSPRGAERTPRG
jgi:hypothetical protein